MGGSNPVSKVIKKVTKPVAKVLDKVVPNEIKPALPYLAAAFPFLAPTTFAGMSSFMPGLGFQGGLQTLAQRGILGGLLNAGSQLSQEGAAERGLNPLSVVLAAGTAGLSGGASGALEGLKVGIPDPGATGLAGGELGILDKARNLGITGLQSASDFLSAGASPQATLMQTVKSAAPSIGMAATEQAVLAAQRAKEEYEKQYEGWQNFTGGQLAEFNAGRKAAILASMGRAGLSQDVIDSTLATLGLRNGGRVGYKDAGIVSLTDQDSGVIYRDENGKPISKEKAMKLFNQQAEEPTREDILQAYADSDTAIKLLEKMVEEGKISQKDFNRMMRIEKDMTDIGNLDFSNYKDKKELMQAEKDMIRKDKKFTELDEQLSKILNRQDKAMGGIINLMGGGMPSMEMDYRGGGFIPVGAKERADDVPARLSKNEFVMTADAVRAAGGGSVNEGARRMYELMNNLEARA